MMSREMKDSGIEWIGEIPKGWEIKKLKYFCNLFGRIGYRGYKTDDLVLEGEGAITLSPSNMKDMKMDYNKLTYLSWEKYEESPEIKVKEEDILFVKTGSTYGKSSFIEYLPMEATINPQILVMKIFNGCGKFLCYNLQTPSTRTQIEQSVIGGTIPTISQEKINNYLFPVPSIPEQQRIANHLDTKCAEIDNLISLQEEMIAELKAYKQSVITEAVCKGLDKNVPMKDSGVEWIGKIPEHWSKCRVKDIFFLKTGTTPKSFDEVNEEEEKINWFTPSDITDECNELKRAERTLLKKNIEKENISLYPKGSLIYVGIGATAGKLGFSLVEGYSNQQITALISKGNNYGKYYFYYLIVDRKGIKENAFFTTLPIINNSYLSQVKVLSPPLSEQQTIANYLDKKCANIDQLISIKQQKADELKEYKKSMIYEYVTGKKEVI